MDQSFKVIKIGVILEKGNWQSFKRSLQEIVLFFGETGRQLDAGNAYVVGICYMLYCGTRLCQTYGNDSGRYFSPT
jgi:hypothetical protein